MTFTEFLNTRPRSISAASFLHLAKDDALWPADSCRLEDFETFLLRALEEESGLVIRDLRTEWRDYARAEPQAKHDQDLALASWADYARHLQSCSGSRLAPCDIAEELLEKALAESNFEDLHHPMRESDDCEGVDDSEKGDDDQLEWPDGEEGEWEEYESEAEDDDASSYC